MRRHPRSAAALAFVASLLVGLVVHFAIERASHEGRVLRATAALGVPLAGLTEAEARLALDRLNPRVRELRARVLVRGKAFEVSAPDVGLEIDAGSTTHAALSRGREGGLLRQFAWWLSRLFSLDATPLATRVDARRAEAFFDSLERAALGEPFAEGAVLWDERLVPEYPREGFALDRKEALRLVQRALSGQDGAPPELPVRRLSPVLSTKHVDDALRVAERWLSQPVVLTNDSGEVAVTFEPASLGRALQSRVERGPPPRLELSLDDAELARVLDAARPKLERPAKDARFAVDASGKITIEPSEPGTRLDDARIFATVRDLVARDERRGALVFRSDVAPKLTTERAEALGIKGLVSKFTTFFPCCEARVKNIERIAHLCDGAVVGPGEVFSLNELVGPRTVANGFVAGPTIVEGEMEMTVGGGVSQFATTLFNAVLDGGYELIQRQPHTYYFSRYPEGHEATVSYPTPDLVFRNDSSAGLLIKTEVGPKHVRVYLYGDNGGRKVVRRVSPRFDVTEPPTEFEPDPKVSPEASKLKTRGTPGWSITVSRIVTFPDGTSKEEKRKVVYNPRPRRVAVHPCRIPKGQNGYTGEECPEPVIPDAGAPEGGPS